MRLSSNQCRRKFLKRIAGGSLVAATFTVAGTKASGKVLGANDRIRVAVAGINGQGRGHINAYARQKDVQIAYLVDPDSRLFDSRSKMVTESGGDAPRCVQDLRQALDDKQLDAVSIASTNHWHALQAIWTCQAGKDVYVEKPCCHNIFEGRKLVEAARKHNRIVQHGTQYRSDPYWVQQVAAVRSGEYGKLLISHAYSSKPRRGIGFQPFITPPQELDFNIWLGPAPEQPYHKNLVHYKWHWFWDFGNGEIGNQGVHQMDVARWAMPEGAAPQGAISLGGRFGQKDQGQTANTQLALIDFGGPKIIFETQRLADSKAVAKVTNEFHVEGGVIKQGKFFPKGQGAGEKLKEFDLAVNPAGHFANFIECVRSRKRENLKAEILEGHLSSMLCHLGNISYRLGTDVPFNRPAEVLSCVSAAFEAFDKMKRRLASDAKLNLAESTYRLGRKLRFDAQTEKFLGDEEADKLLTRNYRRPFVAPEQV